jgi:2-succinyl-5-enolpyruvyl-6-hydroxy-3-cyclohexene-1-carboxylate synthase
VVCTSGTAAANFFPAIIEAHMSQIPLLALTADRPHELRHSGANQTVDQVKLFGDHVLWAVDLPVPVDLLVEDQLPIRNYALTAVRAYQLADGLRKGPVHLNLPFRPPLEPAGSGQYSVGSKQYSVASRQASSERPAVHCSEPTAQALAELVDKYERGLIVCGPRSPGGDFPAAVADLSRQSGYPLLADPLSGLRYGPWVNDTAVCSSYESFMQAGPNWPEPELILRFGALPVSKWLNSYLSRCRPHRRIHVRENGVWADDSHLTSDFIQATETAFCRQLVELLPGRGETAWLAAVMATEQTTRQIQQEAIAQSPFFDGALAGAIVARLPAGSNLFVGNSLPIRHLDQYGTAQAKPLNLFGLRGASGIDGNVSTGLAIAATSAQPTVIWLGDITLYHDMNGLLALTHSLQLAGNVTFVISNNHGGGIFRRLPIARHDPPFTDLFLTPHNLDFGLVADLYDIRYAKVTGFAQFGESLVAALDEPAPADRPAPHLLEVVTDGRADDQIRRQINAIVKERLSINN